MRLPEFIACLSPIAETLAAIETEMLQLAETVEEKNAQFSVSTATDGLTLWEEDYGLPSDGDAESRRRRILAWLRGSSPATTELVRQVAEVFTGAAAEVSEVFHGYCLEIRLRGISGIPERMDELTALLREKLPAHLALKYICSGYTYDQLEQYTYDTLETLTYDKLEGVVLT